MPNPDEQGVPLRDYLATAPPHIQAQFRALEALAWRMVTTRYAHPSTLAAALMACLLTADLAADHHTAEWKRLAAVALAQWTADQVGWTEATASAISDGFDPDSLPWA